MVSQVTSSLSSSTALYSNPFLKDLKNVLENDNSTGLIQPQNTLNGDTCSFSGNVQNPNDITNCLVDKDKNVEITEDGNRYKKTKAGTIIGGILGTAAPIVTRLITKVGFKFKPVAIACTALGLTGAGIGALADAITNSKRAEAADAVTAQQAA